jgi:hypothetical protein
MPTKLTYLLLISLCLVLATSAEVFIRNERPNSQEDALESVYRLFRALDVLKRYGICGSTTANDLHVNQLNATLSNDFETWVINTYNFAGVFNRTAYLDVMRYIAIYVSGGVSQHMVLNSIVTLGNNGRSATISGRLLEIGRFTDSEDNNVMKDEQSASDYTAIVVYQGAPGAGGEWRVKQYTELGNWRLFKGVAPVPHYTRNFCDQL